MSVEEDQIREVEMARVSEQTEMSRYMEDGVLQCRRLSG